MGKPPHTTQKQVYMAWEIYTAENGNIYATTQQMTDEFGN
jgi:hypothetical protein